MGIKGTVRRSTDGDFIHANVDIDLIITEEPEMGNVEKPVEIFHIIEHFCLGRRRLHLFGRDSTIRPGETDPIRNTSNIDRPAGFMNIWIMIFQNDAYLYAPPLMFVFSDLSRLADGGPHSNKQ